MIYTFYSFKGGVGRSMALANVAELLYRRGLKVLIVDFDLEAPGLERYFDVKDAAHRPDEVLCKRGLIDLVQSYKDLRSLFHQTPTESVAMANQIHEFAPQPSPTLESQKKPDSEPFLFPVEPLSDFITPIYERSANGGELSIISAGRRAKDVDVDSEKSRMEFARYAEKVQSFAWDDFYATWNGEQFFDWFRAHAKQAADVVLIDSRTGVTEMSGVCTYHLADVVIMFVTPNYQNLSGALMMARNLTNKRFIDEGRKGRPLSLLFVPSRVESAEGEKLDRFGETFEETFGDLAPPDLKIKTDAFIELKIPYVPYYAYVEDVAVREPKQPKAADLCRAFEKLSATLADLSPVESPLRKNYYPTTVADETDQQTEEAFARLSNADQKQIEFVLTRLIHVGQTDSSHDTFLPVSFDNFEKNEQRLLRDLHRLGLVSITEVDAGEKIVRIADESLNKKWKRLANWVKDNRTFLVWRQQLRVNIDQWDRDRKDRGALLSGSSLVLARQWQERRREKLNDTENYYIIESTRYKNRQTRQRIGQAALVAVAIVAIVFVWRQQQRQHSQSASEMAQESSKFGDSSFVKGDYKSAIDFYTSAISLQPNAKVYNDRGRAFLALEELDRAHADFSLAISFNPVYAEAYMNRGVAYSSTGKPTEALRDLNRAIELDPNNVAAYFNRGEVYNKSGRDLEAINDYSKAIELKRDFLEAYYQRGLAYKRLYTQNPNDRASLKDKATADLKFVKETVKVPGLSDSAGKNLAELVGSETIEPKPATPQIYIYYNDPADSAVINDITNEIRKTFNDVHVQQNDGATAGDIRYYYEEDRKNASRIKVIVDNQLKAKGSEKVIRPIFLGNYYKNVDRGIMEVWIDPLTSKPDSGSPKPVGPEIKEGRIELTTF